MEIIPPVALEIASYGSGPMYTDDEWIANTNYVQNQRIRKQFDGVWHSFRARYSFYSTVGPQYLYNRVGYAWEYLGLSTVSGGYTYGTNDVALSVNPTWTTGEAITASLVRFDPSDNNDYVALTDITTGANIRYPSDAILSSDATVAGYWQKFDAANAWASIDYSLSTKTAYVDTGGSILGGQRRFTYKFVRSSINLIALPNTFNTDWTTSNCTVTANNRAEPTNRSSPSNLTADTVTASAGASVGNPANIWRDFGVIAKGSKVVFAIYIGSDNVTSVTITLRENWGLGSQVSTQYTFPIVSGARYLQVYHEVTQATTTMHAILGGLTAPGNNLILWGAHFGYVGAAFNRIAIMGAENVASAQINIHPWGDLQSAIWGNGSGTTASFSNSPRNDMVAKGSFITNPLLADTTSIQSNTGLVYATNVLHIGFGVTSRDPTIPAAIGSFALGQATTLGGTEWGVESSILSFSRKERDETFGTVTFVKRGSARQVRATAFLDTDIISGDTVQEVLSAFDGVPVFWDFNNNGSTYDRLRVFGFHTNVRTLIQATTWESLSIDIEGLVE